MEKKIQNSKFITSWLSQRNIILEPSFIDNLYGLSMSYKKNMALILSQIYLSLGCSKQNLFYWNSHSYSTQSRKSILKVVENATDFFNLSEQESEKLTNSAGLSLFKLLAIAISLGLSITEINCLLHQYGYCLSKSLANDMVIDWFIRNSGKYPNESAALLKEINETLDYMGFPLLMTRLK